MGRHKEAKKNAGTGASERKVDVSCTPCHNYQGKMRAWRRWAIGLGCSCIAVHRINRCAGGQGTAVGARGRRYPPAIERLRATWNCRFADAGCERRGTGSVGGSDLAVFQRPLVPFTCCHATCLPPVAMQKMLSSETQRKTRRQASWFILSSAGREHLFFPLWALFINLGSLNLRPHASSQDNQPTPSVPAVAHC